MTWTDLSGAFTYGSKLTSTQMQNLRDNIASAFAKDGGAPVLANDYIVTAMIADDQITNALMANEAVGIDEIKDYAASGDYTEIMDNGELSGDFSATPTKYAEIRVPRAGTIRTTFELKKDASAQNGYGRIYKNGAAHGTQRTTTTSYVEHTEDLAFEKDDLLQLYISDSGTVTSYFKNFGFYVDNTLANPELVDGL